MAAYYAVKVVVTTESENGRLKNHTEMHLVSGETPEDAAFKVREYYGSETRDYTVDTVNKTKYLSVID
jgi:NADPH:quinone reductase-like Zn-dependent oxidoreductase